MPPLPIILLIALVVVLALVLGVLFLLERRRRPQLDDGSVSTVGLDELADDVIARRIGTRAEAPDRLPRSRRRHDPYDDTEPAAREGVAAAVPEAAAIEPVVFDEDVRLVPYDPGESSARLRLWRNAAAGLLVVCLAILAVSIVLPGLSKPSPSASPSGIAQASFTPRPTRTPRPTPTATPAPTPTPAPVVPGTPDGLRAVPAADAMSLSWNAPFDGGSPIIGYEIYRGTTAGSETLLATSGVEPSYNDLAVGPGKTFTYYVRAINAIGSGDPSAEVSGTIPISGPGRPGTLTASASSSSISLSWSPPSTDGGSSIVGYNVYRSTSSGNEAFIVRLGTVTSYTNTGLAPGFRYYYVVRAVNSTGAGFASNEASAAIAAVTPGAPFGLTATSNPGSVDLSWSPPSSNGGSSISSYRVLRSTTSGSGYGQVGTVTCSCSSPVTYSDSTVVAGSQYYYVVQAVNGVGTGGTSNQAMGLTVPAAPVLAALTVGGGQISLSWTTPASTGSTITGYVVLRGTASGAYTEIAFPPATSYSDSDIVAGTTYFYAVLAVNGVGDSPYSNERASALTVPGAPTGVTAVAHNGSVDVSWTAPSFDGGAPITGYAVTGSPGGTCLTATLSCTVGGLTNGTAYTFTVAASNAAGPGAASAASSSVTPYTTPGAPTFQSATAGHGQITVGWTAAAPNGAAITLYTVTASPGGATCTWSTGDGALSCTVTGLADGTAYTFQIVAQNAAGGGPASAASPPVSTFDVPGAPTGVTANPDNGSADISWIAPLDDGGSAVTGYTVTSSPGGKTCTTNGALGCTVSGLTNGTVYTFTVVSKNAIGTGSPSAASTGVTPSTVPGAPVPLTIDASVPGTITITWSDPLTDGGSTILGFRVYRDSGSGFVNVSGNLSTSTHSYDDTTVVASTAYDYVIRAFNTNGESASSSPLLSATAQ